MHLDRRLEQSAIATTAAGSCLALIFTIQAAVNSLLVRRADPHAPEVASLDAGGERISVLIPARNEAHRIGPTISSVLASDGVAELEVLILDDHSTDETVAVVQRIVGDDLRVQIISGKELPEGWLGKPWACDQLGRAATGSVLIFVDADVVLEPSALRATVALLSTHRLSLVSPYPRQIVGSPGERLVQPLLQWLWMSFVPLRLAELPRPVSMAVANGQLLAVRAEAWRKVGGHRAVRNDVIEDVGLAKAFKRQGFRATVAEGSQIVSCRMYSDWSEVTAGYTKSLWAALPTRRAARAVGAMLGLAYLVPVVGFVGGMLLRRRSLAGLGLVGYAAGVLGRVISARTTRGSVRDSVAHPFSIASLLWLGSQSWRRLDGGQLQWKGRDIRGR